MVRGGYKAFAEGDIETVLSLLDPDITLEEREPTLDTPSTYHGDQGILDMVARVNEGLEDVKYAPERFVDMGDQVLVEVRRKGRGSLSGVPVERWQFHIWDIAEGRRFGSARTPTATKPSKPRGCRRRRCRRRT